MPCHAPRHNCGVSSRHVTAHSRTAGAAARCAGPGLWNVVTASLNAHLQGLIVHLKQCHVTQVCGSCRKAVSQSITPRSPRPSPLLLQRSGDRCCCSSRHGGVRVDLVAAPIRTEGRSGCGVCHCDARVRAARCSRNRHHSHR